MHLKIDTKYNGLFSSSINKRVWTFRKRRSLVSYLISANAFLEIDVRFRTLAAEHDTAIIYSITWNWLWHAPCTYTDGFDIIHSPTYSCLCIIIWSVDFGLPIIFMNTFQINSFQINAIKNAHKSQQQQLVATWAQICYCCCCWLLANKWHLQSTETFMKTVDDLRFLMG